MSFQKHLKAYEDLITPYDQIRSGFIALALEKNKKATPFIEEAKALKVLASRANTPNELLMIDEIHDALLTAAGISGKAKNYLQESDRQEAIKNLLENFLEPSGHSLNIFYWCSDRGSHGSRNISATE